MKDKPYYDMNNGGVTFSGGEPLLQIRALEPLLQKLKQEKVNMCIETALTVPEKYVECMTEKEAADLLGDGWTVDVISHIFRNIK